MLSDHAKPRAGRGRCCSGPVHRLGIVHVSTRALVLDVGDMFDRSMLELADEAKAAGHRVGVLTNDMVAINGPEWGARNPERGTRNQRKDTGRGPEVRVGSGDQGGLKPLVCVVHAEPWLPGGADAAAASGADSAASRTGGRHSTSVTMCPSCTTLPCWLKS